MSINPEDIRTIPDLVEELGCSKHKVKALLEGVKPVLQTRTGRTPFYDKKDVRKALYAQERALFDFMGYLSPDVSNDVVTATDAQASVDEN